MLNKKEISENLGEFITAIINGAIDLSQTEKFNSLTLQEVNVALILSAGYLTGKLDRDPEFAIRNLMEGIKWGSDKDVEYRMLREIKND